MDVSVGNGYDSPLPSLVFEQMVARSNAVQVGFEGDLYWDAMVLAEILAPVKTGDSAVFLWVLRPSGTHIVRTDANGQGGESLARAIASQSRGSTVYRFEVRERNRDRYRLDWCLTVTRVWHNGR